MVNLVRMLIPDGVLRAHVLSYLRWAGAAAGGAVSGYLVKQGVSLTDAASIAAAVAGLIIAVGSAVFDHLDVVGVDKQVQAATVQSAMTAQVLKDLGQGNA